MARIDPTERAQARVIRAAQAQERSQQASTRRTNDRKGKVVDGLKANGRNPDGTLRARAVGAELGKGVGRAMKGSGQRINANWQDNKAGVKRASINGSKNVGLGAGYGLGTAAYWTGRGPWVGLTKVTKGLWNSNHFPKTSRALAIVLAPLTAAAGVLNLTRKAAVGLTKFAMVHSGREQQYNKLAKAFSRPDQAVGKLMERQVANRAQARDMQRMMKDGSIDFNGNLQFDAADTTARQARNNARAANTSQSDKFARGNAGRVLADITIAAKDLNDKSSKNFAAPREQINNAMNDVNDIHKSFRRDFGIDDDSADKLMKNVFGVDVTEAVLNLDPSKNLSTSEQELLGGIKAYAEKSASYDSKNMNWEMAASASVIRSAAMEMGISTSGSARMTDKELDALEDADMELGAASRLSQTSANFEANPDNGREALDRATAVQERTIELNPVMDKGSRSAADMGVAI